MQTPAGIKNAMSAITHGVYVLGVHTPEKDNLMTAAWLCQVSSAPPTLVVAVSSKHLTTQLISQAGGFAVSVLSEEQRETALRNGRISGRDCDKLLDTPTVPGETGHPLVAQALAYLECELTDSLAAGDHIVFLGQVVRGERYPGEPLLYRESEFFG